MVVRGTLGRGIWCRIPRVAGRHLGRAEGHVFGCAWRCRYCCSVPVFYFIPICARNIASSSPVIARHVPVARLSSLIFNIRVRSSSTTELWSADTIRRIWCFLPSVSVVLKLFGPVLRTEHGFVRYPSMSTPPSIAFLKLSRSDSLVRTRYSLSCLYSGLRSLSVTRPSFVKIIKPLESLSSRPIGKTSLGKPALFLISFSPSWGECVITPTGLLY